MEGERRGITLEAFRLLVLGYLRIFVLPLTIIAEIRGSERTKALLRLLGTHYRHVNRINLKFPDAVHYARLAGSQLCYMHVSSPAERRVPRGGRSTIGTGDHAMSSNPSPSS